MLRLSNLCFRFGKRLFDVARVHPRQNLAWRNHVANIDQQFSNAAGAFGIDVDLVRLDAAVAKTDAEGQRRIGVFPDIVTGATGAAQNHKDREPHPSESTLA